LLFQVFPEIFVPSGFLRVSTTRVNLEKQFCVAHGPTETKSPAPDFNEENSGNLKKTARCSNYVGQIVSAAKLPFFDNIISREKDVTVRGSTDVHLIRLHRVHRVATATFWSIVHSIMVEK
jgi:hypothetical protein